MITENGWPSCSADGCQWITVPGTTVSLQLQKGQPLAIMRAYAADYNAFVEPLRDADSAAWTPTNSVATSNHLGGTAMDLNWNSHPFRVADAGYTPQMIATMRELLDFYEGTMFWSNDWDDPKDAMHHQMGYGTYGNPDTADFIARKIRPDGYSTFRRGAGPSVDLVGLLAQAMSPTSVSGARLGALLPAVSQCLRDCGCTTVSRIATWCAQIGHESAGLRYMEEIASGAAYEGRCNDLGNCQPGDGVRFKGRGPIQVTGRGNYTELSEWAYDHGLVPSPTFFVDNPAQLASDQYGFIGVTWYWTTQRPMNDAADAGDIERATRYVNGGLNGLEDTPTGPGRRTRYRTALALGDRLLALVNTTATTDPIEELLMSGLEVESLSIYATPGEPNIPIVRMLQAIDANEHRDLVEDWARRGDTDSLARIARTAAGQGKFTDPATVAHAKAVLNDIEATNPAVLQAFLSTQKGA